MLALDIDLPFVRHPCPRVRHHPGEHCNCAQRLDVRVPHGYSRASDKGSLHAARLQNLRWRVSAPCQRGRAEDTVLPPSLGSLAEDHRSHAVAKSLRPLSPERQRCRGGLGKRRVLAELRGGGGSTSSTSEADAANEESVDAVLEAGAPTGTTPPKLCRRGSTRHNVSFSETLEAEVPIIVPAPARVLMRIPRRRRSRGAGRADALEESKHRDSLARANLSRLLANHKRMSGNLSDLADCMGLGNCLEFVKVMFGHAPARLTKADGAYIKETM